MSSKFQTMLAVGDVYLYGVPPAELLFAKTAPVLRSADIALGHGKCMFTSRGVNTFAEPIKLKDIEEDIKKLRALCDVLVVFFSKGIGFLPVRLVMYK
ncbi:hypothetical protein ACFLYQ_04595 [Chloroflexota bacterium]